ncbi:subtilase-type protease inhibitor [Streptomyces sp. NPDC006208]|uniref:subtilase-type protease inhibitor n=1 Tax=Streptomyces sp. NPDC006208 TaxID=3156734 RepID=UPI0033AAAB0F
MRRLAGKALGAAGLVTGLSVLFAGPAHAEPAQPKSLYAPSAMVLTIGKGETARSATVQRAVTLRCNPNPGGDHPDAPAACAELQSVEGRPALLSNDEPSRYCTRIYDPVTVTLDGVWEGRRISHEATFANSCVMQGEVTQLFSF